MDEFSYVVEAIPPDLPLDQDATERLCSQVFLLLSLIAGQEIGVAPLVGSVLIGRLILEARGPDTNRVVPTVPDVEDKTRPAVDTERSELRLDLRPAPLSALPYLPSEPSGATNAA